MSALRQISRLWPAGLFSLLSACVSSEERQTFPVDTEQELEQVLPSLRPGDVLMRRSIQFVVPPAGMGRSMELLFVDGHLEELNVRTAADGTVALVRDTPSHQAMDVHALSACDNRAYTLEGFKQHKPLRWYFNPSTTPADFTPTEAENALRAAASSITTGYNDCGLPDNINAQEQYLGRTTRIASGCDNNAFDGFNVVGFGDLDASILALTCRSVDFAHGDIVESDIRINKIDHRWTVQADSPTCKDRFGVQNVVTHEFGHAFGLGHVNAPELTMGTYFPPCDVRAKTLGLGDILGLRALYP